MRWPLGVPAAVQCAVIGVKKVRPSGGPSITVYLDDGVTVAAATILPQVHQFSRATRPSGVIAGVSR